MVKDKEIAELIHSAQVAMRDRHHQEARGLFLRALEAKPGAPDAHYGLATVCFMQGDVLGAAHHFKEVTRFDPLRAGAYINLGALYNHLGRGDDAIAALKRGIQLDPKRAEGHYNLGLAYRRVGHLDHAVAAYREAVRLQPDMAEAHFNLANILLEDDKFAHAVAHYKAALKVRSDWPEAAEGLAIAEAGLGEQETPPPPPTPETAVELPKHDDAPAASGPRLDPHRPLDPTRHGAVLTEIHKATADVEAVSKNLGSAAAHQLENALKELANCFLRHDTPNHELTKRLEAFETAAQNVKHLHAELERLRKSIEAASDSLNKA